MQALNNHENVAVKAGTYMPKQRSHVWAKEVRALFGEGHLELAESKISSKPSIPRGRKPLTAEINTFLPCKSRVSM